MPKNFVPKQQTELKEILLHTVTEEHMHLNQDRPETHYKDALSYTCLILTNNSTVDCSGSKLSKPLLTS